MCTHVCAHTHLYTLCSYTLGLSVRFTDLRHRAPPRRAHSGVCITNSIPVIVSTLHNTSNSHCSHVDRNVGRLTHTSLKTPPSKATSKPCVKGYASTPPDPHTLSHACSQSASEAGPVVGPPPSRGPAPRPPATRPPSQRTRRPRARRGASPPAAAAAAWAARR